MNQSPNARFPRIREIQITETSKQTSLLYNAKKIVRVRRRLHLVDFYI